MNDNMFILVNLQTNECYYSKVLRPLSLVVGTTTQTLRNWLRNKDIALKQGYFIGSGVRLYSNQGKGNSIIR